MARESDVDYPLNDPRNEQHRQHRLYAQIDEGVERLSSRAGGVDPDVNERTKMSLFNQADKDRLQSVDHLVPNGPGKVHQAGTLAVMVQGKDPYDPACPRSCMELVEAARRQIDDSMQDYQSRNKANNISNAAPTLDQTITQLETELRQQQSAPDQQTIKR